MDRLAAGRSIRSWTLDDISREVGPVTTLWRVPVDVELVVEAEDQEAAIRKAEELLERVKPAPPLPRNTKVEVVISLPMRVGRE
jgi:hypothetical protein